MKPYIMPVVLAIATAISFLAGIYLEHQHIISVQKQQTELIEALKRTNEELVLKNEGLSAGIKAQNFANGEVWAQVTVWKEKYQHACEILLSIGDKFIEKLDKAK